MSFTGVAEVEFKLDSRLGEYKLIEINPIPWDQHRLGHMCGVDLIHIAWCDLTGEALSHQFPFQKDRTEVDSGGCLLSSSAPFSPEARRKF